MQEPTPTAASAETRLIPLKKLRVDERNVRSASADPARVQADAELTASIKAHGLLQNLVVVPRGKTQFGVAAGARRLRALKALAADRHLSFSSVPPESLFGQQQSLVVSAEWLTGAVSR